MSARVCIFGVDSMEPRLIDSLIASGKLPNLAALRKRACWGAVLNPPRFFSGASWPNFYTGTSARRHGQYLHTRYDRSSLVHEPFRPADKVDAFWLRPGWMEKRSAVLNVPYCPPDARVNGIQVVDRYGHDHDHKGVLPGSPPQTANLMILPGALEAGCNNCVPTLSGLHQLRSELMRRLRQKSELTLSMLASESWDLFVSVVDEPHCAGHQFWHLHDPSYPRRAEHEVKALGDPIEEIYRETDRALGAVLDAVEPDSTLIFLSSHGMGPVFDANVLLDELLRRFEGFPPVDPSEEDVVPAPLAPLRSTWMRLPAAVRGALEPVRRRIGRRRTADRLVGERQRRKCFWFPTHDLWGGIRLNVVGRESPGVLKPGPELERFIGELERNLHALRDGLSGEPIVGEIKRVADIDLEGFDGDFPDLVVHWSKTALSWVESPAVGRIDAFAQLGRTGDHHPDMRGVFFAVGPTVQPGCIADVRLEDFAPTVATLLNVSPAAADMDGTVIQGIVARERNERHSG
jgi:predicted AlkP superfamily phosphohydrolase/phosphomutase